MRRPYNIPKFIDCDGLDDRSLLFLSYVHWLDLIDLVKNDKWFHLGNGNPLFGGYCPLCNNYCDKCYDPVDHSLCPLAVYNEIEGHIKCDDYKHFWSGVFRAWSSGRKHYFLMNAKKLLRLIKFKVFCLYNWDGSER